MRSSSRRPSVPSVVAAAVVLATLVTACSSTPDKAESSDTTTGTVDRLEPTTEPPGSAGSGPSTSAPGEDALPGLWLASPAGITDEEGNHYATPQGGQVLQTPIDDEAGGVYYLRCPIPPAGVPTGTCKVEHAVEKDGTPQVLGDADQLLALGYYHDHPVLITGWTDPARVPDQAANRSGLVMRLMDAETGAVQGPYEWYGWESSPFAADVESDQFVACMGEGESCQLDLIGSPDGAPVAVPDVDMSTVRSLALAQDAKVLAWVDQEPMNGGVSVHVRDLSSGEKNDTQLRGAGDEVVSDAVTDGRWVALRTLQKVTLDQIGGENRSGEREVPADVTDMAIRSGGGGGGGMNPL